MPIPAPIPVQVQQRVRKSATLRREEILDEAIRQIGRLGFRGFTVRELSAACGMSNAGMLHYFPSKTELLIAVIDHLELRQTARLQGYIDACAAADRAGQTALTEFRALLSAMMRQVLEDPELARLVALVQVEALDPDHPAHASFLRREAAALAFLEDMLASLVGDSVAVARGLHAAMSGLALQWLREGGTFDVMQTWEVIASRLLSGAAQ